jgi:hypothetical protein
MANLAGAVVIRAHHDRPTIAGARRRGNAVKWIHRARVSKARDSLMGLHEGMEDGARHQHELAEGA